MKIRTSIALSVLAIGVATATPSYAQDARGIVASLGPIMSHEEVTNPQISELKDMVVAGKFDEAKARAAALDDELRYELGLVEAVRGVQALRDGDYRVGVGFERRAAELVPSDKGDAVAAFHQACVAAVGIWRSMQPDAVVPNAAVLCAPRG